MLVQTGWYRDLNTAIPTQLVQIVNFRNKKRFRRISSRFDKQASLEGIPSVFAFPGYRPRRLLFALSTIFDAFSLTSSKGNLCLLCYLFVVSSPTELQYHFQLIRVLTSQTGYKCIGRTLLATYGRSRIPFQHTCPLGSDFHRSLKP